MRALSSPGPTPSATLGDLGSLLYLLHGFAVDDVNQRTQCRRYAGHMIHSALSNIENDMLVHKRPPNLVRKKLAEIGAV